MRIVPATELHAEALISEGSGEADGEGEEMEVVTEDETPLRTNRETVDDASSQKLTLAEIEALKKESTGAGKEIIAKLLESHTALDQKTAFSLAKYTVRKRKKYLRRFTVLPMDVNLLTNFMLEEKDAPRIMELRTELIGLVGCLGNVHHGGNVPFDATLGLKPDGRYLVVDETGGLVVAAMAERMGILYPHSDDEDQEEETEQQASEQPTNENTEKDDSNPDSEQQTNNSAPSKPRRARRAAMSATGNTITLLHAHTQPNLSLLKYFGFSVDNPDESHPLYAHLKTVSWMQLLDPNADTIYANEPEEIPDEILSTYKPSKRSIYHRKRGRWARVRSVVDEARAGGFDGLVVATLMEPASVMKHAVPLLSGSASVVVYSPTIEPLVELVDLYSTARRTAYIYRKREIQERSPRQQSNTPQFESQSAEQEQPENQTETGTGTGNTPDDTTKTDLSELDAEFPVDPTLLLAPTLHTTRARHWQVLPGRTHPLMSGRGGAEGYIFHGIRVLPSQEHIQAAGNPSRKKRKIVSSKDQTGTTPSTSDGDGSGVDVEMNM